jgi:hypothetical protein
MSKLRVGIDINEIIRAKWLQFDKYYVQEFGEEGVPKDEQHVFDFFKTYQWKDTVEIDKELKEPDELPETINPVDYQIDEKTGESNADFLLFKKTEKKLITAKEVYNRFMFEDFVFEIFGNAPLMYKGLDLHLKEFCLKYGSHVDLILLSVENFFSIPSTLFFLSKVTSRFKNYCFVEKANEMWKHVDVLLTTDPEILEGGIPWGKKLIKVNRPYNENIKTGSMMISHFSDLIVNKDNQVIANEKFEKIIKI